jgi:putative transposase
VKRPHERKTLAIAAIAKFELKARRACRIFGINRFTWHYKRKPDRNVALRARIVELASTQPYGCQMIHDTIRNEWPTPVNHKRTERIYREEGLLLKKRKKNKKLRLVRQPLPVPVSQDDVWAMDFIFDRLASGRQLKVLTMTDHFSKLIPDLFVAHSIRGYDVVSVLDRLAKIGRKPKIIVVDNGSEFRSKALAKWARDNGVKLHFIEPGKPQQNAFIESFNSRFRAECLEQNLFETISEAGLLICKWKSDYENIRPHSSLGGLPPAEFVRRQAA